MKREIKLLPCPFCGGEAHFTDSIHTHAGVDMIMCAECGCRVYGGINEKWNSRVLLFTEIGLKIDLKEIVQEIKCEAFDPWVFNDQEKQYMGNFDEQECLDILKKSLVIQFERENK